MVRREKRQKRGKIYKTGLRGKKRRKMWERERNEREK
jgi:hypothetical protein